MVASNPQVEGESSTESQSSYAHVLKAASIMGGAAGVNMLLGMVKTKFAAVLIGASGIGLLASFLALQRFSGVLAGLGIQASAVRELALAVGTGDGEAIAKGVLTLRRVCWVTGGMGLLIMALFNQPISQFVFNTGEYGPHVIAIGFLILIANISGGQMALIQAHRRIGDLARMNILTGAIAVVVAVSFYFALGVAGIVPSLVVIALIQLAISYHFARKISIEVVQLSWVATLIESRAMVRLGFYFMLTGLMSSGVAFAIIAYITKTEGIAAVGLYSASFALSGMFVTYVLGSMGADFYPRLTSVSNKPETVVRLVNEQAEIGLYLALPGLFATMWLAPWILQVFYTSEFVKASILIQWFVVGCLGRVLSWPLGYIVLAVGKNKWFLFSESIFNVVHLGMVIMLMSQLGLVGVAIAYPVAYLGYYFLVYVIVKHLVGFRLEKHVLLLSAFSVFVLSAGFVFLSFFEVPKLLEVVLFTTLQLLLLMFCVTRVAGRLNQNHRLNKMLTRLRISIRSRSE